MNRKNLLITIGFIFFLIFSFLFLSSYKDEPVFAQASCPSSIDPSSIECLDYLRNQLSQLEKQQGTIQKQLKDEEYQQLTLSEKISYINNQIEQTEKVIKSLEVEIAANDVEIKLLQEAITELEDSISLLRQEISILEKSVTKRVTESYKYSYIGPLELFLDIKNLSNILRKTKYLAMTRSQDKKSLEDYGVKIDDIRSEEEILAEKKASLQIVRNSIEEEKIELAETRESLNAQKSERERLLAESKAKEAELLAAYQSNLKKLSDLDSAIIAYINTHGDQARMYGRVNGGDWIGRMGNTGYSSGAHLHFSVRSSNSGSVCNGNIPILSGHLREGEPSWITGWDGWRWPYMYAGSMRMPIAGPYVIMSQNYHQGYAIDLISFKTDRTVNYGAPIYAILPGTLYRGKDGYGGVYAYIVHDNGWVSCYLHIQE